MTAFIHFCRCSGLKMAAALFAVGLLCTPPATAAPSAKLWAYWSKHNPAAKRIVDHGTWEGFLKRYLVVVKTGINLFAYRRVSKTGRATLGAYINGLTAVRVTDLTRAEQRAYWINLYNALTIKAVLDRWPVKSIRDINISPGLFTRGPWGKKLITIEGHAVSLDDIEHRILRPIWRDPRIHYAVNCASIGCPNLQSFAFTAVNTEQLLDTGARAYVNHPRGVRVAGGRLRVSSIYHWFKVDFGGTDTGVIAHLRRYARPALKAKLTHVRAVDGHGYDWSINASR